MSILEKKLLKVLSRFQIKISHVVLEVNDV